MDYNIFKKTQLAAAVSMVVGAATISPVYAQDDIAENTLEEVVVTGIRGSLQRAMDIKRDAQGVVDSISSEDIGKFPDTNLAESLQRITGVSINRSNGEGQEITVRGLGPDFNLVTLNGRQMPTSGLEGTTVNASRSFDFSNIASEGISGVDVYKTSRANIPTGGMGATVNVKTTRPLEAPGLKFTVGAKAVLDDSSADSSLTPELSALYSQTFADDMFGVALSLSSQNRKGGFRQVSVPDGWHTQAVQPLNDWGQNGAFVDADGPINSAEDYITRPQNIEYNFTEFERDRTNGQLTLQYAPTDAITATLDYTYSELEIATQQNTTNVWFWEGYSLNDTDTEWALGSANNDGGNVYYPVVLGHVANGGDTVFGTANFAQVNTNNSIGFNLEWQATDNLSLELDFHSSDATSEAASPYGNSSVIQVAGFNRAGAVVDFSQDFAVMGALEAGAGGEGDPTGEFLTAADLPSSLLTATGSSLRNSSFENEIQQVQLHGTYTFDDGLIKSVDFGVTQTDNSIHRGIMVAQRDTWGGEGTAANLRDDIFTANSILGDFGSLGGTGRLANSEETFNQFDLYYTFAFPEVAADIVAFAAPDNSAENEVSAGTWPCADRFCVNDNWTTNQRTEETYSSAYLQANLELDTSVAVVQATVGARYETTDVTSSAVVPAYSGINWVANNEFSLVDDGSSSSTSFDSDYEHFLPSIDISASFANDVVARVSYSETIARANYNSIAGGYTLGTLRGAAGDASIGDPTLVPHESNNLDLSIEWYFGDASYVSAGWFSKDVANFIGTSTGAELENLYGLRNPSAGPRFDEALAAVSDPNDTNEVRQYIIDNYPDSTTANSDPGIPGVIHSVDADPLYMFNVSTPINNEKAKISGYEFAVQHTLESGFGAQFNWTMVDSSAQYDETEFDSQFALVGLSDTLNAVLFYENDRFQARLAYNWRDAFLLNSQRNHGNPEFNEEYSQIDMNASYEVTDQFSVFVEGLNITNETQRTYSRYEGMLQSATELGARYNLGARYTF